MANADAKSTSDPFEIASLAIRSAIGPIIGSSLYAKKLVYDILYICYGCWYKT